jgi:hypothetical protein
MSPNSKNYHVEVDWQTVVPLGDTLAVRTGAGFDERWVKAFQVVRDEHQLRSNGPDWGAIDFEFSPGAHPVFVLYVRGIKPSAQSLDLRLTVNDLFKATNKVAQIGTHVYDLANELRESKPDQTSGGRPSTPPPARERADERRAA